MVVLTAEVDGRNTGEKNPREIEIPLLVWDGLTPAQKVLHYFEYEHEDMIRETDWLEVKTFLEEKMKRITNGVDHFTRNARIKSGKIQFHL